MNWELLIDDSIKKQLKRIPKREVEHITDAIREFSVDPYAGDIEKMEGEDNAWRKRIGSYRILYEIRTAQKIIYVFDVKRRTSNTY